MLKNCRIIGENVSYETYSRQEPDVKRGDPQFSMSRGELVSVSLCPRRWLDGFGVEDDSTSATEWGSLIDCLLTSRESFEARFAVSPETYTDAKTGEQKPWTMAANVCKAWKKEQGNKSIIKADLMADASKAVAAIQENPLLAELFAVSKKQMMIIGFWQDESTGIEVPVRVLADLIPPKGHATFGKWLCDFKTCRNGNPAIWPKVIDDSAYDIQAALITDLFVGATGEDRTDFIHVVQENVFPFHVVTPPPALSSEFLDWGRQKYKKALRLYCQCLKTGEWPSYAKTGLAFGSTQIIAPDGLWSYRQGAGMAEFKEPPTKQSYVAGIDHLAGA